MDVTGLYLPLPKTTPSVLPCVGSYIMTGVVKSHRVSCVGAWGYRNAGEKRTLSTSDEESFDLDLEG